MSTAKTSYARIFKIALPILASNAMLPLIGLVDAGVIGRMGEVAPLAAVGLGAAILASVFWLFNFLQLTTTASVGRAIGEDRKDSIQHFFTRALALATILMPLAVVLYFLLTWGVPVLFNTSTEVSVHLETYLSIRLLAFPTVLLFHVFTGYLLAFERTKTILIIELVMQIINVTLDLIFVLGLNWGVAGVAWASVIAEVSGAILVIWVLRTQVLSAVMVLRQNMLQMLVNGVSPSGETRAYGLNSGAFFVRALCLNATIHIFNYHSTSLGDEILAINAVLMVFLNFVAQTTDGFAVSVEILTARAIGQKNLGALRQNFRRASFVSIAITAVLMIVFFVFSDHLFAMISTNEDLRVLSQPYWNWVLLAIAIGILAWCVDGLFFGASLGFEMMVAGIFSLLLFVVAAEFLSRIHDNHGLWIAFAFSYAFRLLALIYYYPRVERLISSDLISANKPKPW